jgi:hypothetical protein
MSVSEQEREGRGPAAEGADGQGADGEARYEHDARAPTAESACEACGAGLRPDQEWCLECGTARTLIHRSPSWKAPAALVATVAILALVGLGIAVASLSSQSNRSAAAELITEPARTVTVTVTVPSAPARRRHARPGARRISAEAASTRPPAGSVGSWPIGLPGWTVVLSTQPTQGEAERLAHTYASQGLSVGVLESSQHPSLPPGDWLVFSGRYPTEAGAAAEAAVLRARGYPVAHPDEVAPTGG